MAIEPVYGPSMRTDPLLQRRNQPALSGDAPADAGTASANPRTGFGQQLPPQVLQMMQQGRETSALLSTLPGPNLSFFQPPGLPQGFGGGAGGPGGARRQLNVPLLETEMRGGVTSALLSPLMGTNPRAFQPPAPPIFAGPNAAAPAGPLAAAAQAAGPLAGGPLATGPLAAAAQAAGPLAAGAQGSGPLAAAAPLPRAGAQLLETEQAGRTTSRLLSSLMSPQQPAGSFGPSSFAGPAAGHEGGDSLAAMRTAEAVLQTVDTTAPSAANIRIANEAYQMEAQAQQQYARGATGRSNWEWFA